MKILGITFRTLLLAMFLSCFAHQAFAEDIMELSSALTKLSAAVESTVRYKNPPENLTDEELLVLSSKHDPELLRPFTEYLVRVKTQDKHAIVLVCSKDGKIGLLEDAGCSAKMDNHLWKAEPPKACVFTLSVSSACSPN